ncbi:MAG: hypothetical protein WA421_01020 [Nitrososphaeraceae archaeon]|jgi:hypothetical protein
MSSIRNIQSRVQRQITVDTFYESELGQAIYSLGKHISRADNRTHQRRFQDRHPTNKKVSESSGNTTCYQYFFIKSLFKIIARHAKSVLKQSNTC